MAFRRRSPLRAKRPVRGKYARKYTKRPARRTSMVKLIKRVVHKMAENKVKNKTGLVALSNTYFTSTWNSNNVLPLSPYQSYIDIAQGNGQGDRIGNKISTRRLMLTFVIHPYGYQAENNVFPLPQDIRIVIGKFKDNSTQLQGLGTGVSSIFQNGGSSSSPSGQLSDIVRSLNKDIFTCYYDKVVKVGNSNYIGTGNDPKPQYYANNDYKLNVVRKIDCTKWCNKTIDFNDTTALPSVPVLSMFAFCCNADGSAGSKYNSVMWYELKYEYEDM